MTTPLRQAYAATSRESPNAIVRLGRSWLGRVLRLGQPRGLHPRPRLNRQLSQTTGVAYISSGALPRAEIARGGDLGRRFAHVSTISGIGTAFAARAAGEP